MSHGTGADSGCLLNPLRQECEDMALSPWVSCMRAAAGENFVLRPMVNRQTESTPSILGILNELFLGCGSFMSPKG